MQKDHRGYYRCIYKNETITAVLRVKGLFKIIDFFKTDLYQLDPYAALWPFIGIVSTVLVLITIILFYEHRQKVAKKAAAAANEEVIDNLNDP